MEVLDNPGWSALTGPQAQFALGGARARRFPPDVAPFGALPDEIDDHAWHDLDEAVGVDGHVAVFRSGLEVPQGWYEHMRVHVAQYVWPGVEPPPAPDVGADELGDADAADMQALVALTEPGPFLARTHRLGRYLGVRHEGRLVAMAGERLRPVGYTEVSAVCTEPGHRRRGLAAALMVDLMHSIRARGDTPFLHVSATNPAITLYEAMGFVRRTSLEVVVVSPPRP